MFSCLVLFSCPHRYRLFLFFGFIAQLMKNETCWRHYRRHYTKIKIDANVTFNDIFVIIINNNILLDRMKERVLRCLKQCSIISINYSLFNSARRYYAETNSVYIGIAINFYIIEREFTLKRFQL